MSFPFCARFRHLTALSASIALTSLAASAMPPPADSQAQHFGGHAVESRIFDQFLLAENANIASHTRVYVAKPSVEFNARWQRDHRHKLNDRFLANTRERYAEVLQQALVDALNASDHFQVQDTPEPGVLMVNSSVSDLIINGPDYDPLIDHYVDRAGDARIDVRLVLHEGATLAHFNDHDETRLRGLNTHEKTSRVQNQRDFRFLFEKWAKALTEEMKRH